MKQMGAPDGFIDVVASVSPLVRADSGTPPHWGVIFAVDNADDTAAKATKLGGEVVTGPIEAPWTRWS